MSSSDAPVPAALTPAPAALPVTVAASDAAAEVFIVDSGFGVVARGIGRVFATVPPGIYRAKAKVGELQNEVLFALDEDDTAGTTIPVEAPAFASPIPLAGTSTHANAHEEAAEAMSRSDHPRLSLGSGARLVLVFRDPAMAGAALDAEALAAYAQAWRGITLADAAGDHRLVLADAGALDAHAGWLLVEAEVDPGGWVVSVPVPGRPDQCVPLVASAGWATQLFVNLGLGAEGSLRRFRLDDAAIVLDRPGAPFIADRHDLRVLEVARQALAGGHNIVAGPVMDELLAGKFESPMMGLVASHLLLLDASPNLDRIAHVVGNTGGLVGANHPDVLALRLRVDQLRGQPATALSGLLEAVRQPPMLRLSWAYLMAAVSSPAAGGSAALAARRPFALATCVVGSALWLTWEDLPLPEPAEMSAIVPPPAASGAPAPAPSGPPTIDMLRRHTRVMRKNGGGEGVGGVGGVAGRMAGGALEMGAAAQRLWTRVSSSGVLGRLFGGAKPPSLQDAAQASIAFLLDQHDWDEVVRRLKQEPEEAAELTSLQRSLLMALRSAKQQWRDEGGMPPLQVFVDWLASRNATWTSIAADLKAVLQLAERILRRR